MRRQPRHSALKADPTGSGKAQRAGVANDGTETRRTSVKTSHACIALGFTAKILCREMDKFQTQLEIGSGIEISRQVTAVVLFWSTSLDTEQTLAASELISFVV